MIDTHSPVLIFPVMHLTFIRMTPDEDEVEDVKSPVDMNDKRERKAFYHRWQIYQAIMQRAAKQRKEQQRERTGVRTEPQA